MAVEPPTASDGSTTPAGGPEPTPTAPAVALDPQALLRSRSYLVLVLLAGIIGAPVSVAAYWFLKLVNWLQHELYTAVPSDLGFHGTPRWWSFPLLAVAGILVSLVIGRLPGRGGHSPADGFQMGGTPLPVDIPGVFLAAVASLGLGVVLGPEAPLIAIGGGLGALAVHLVKRDAPPMAATVIAAAGSFAAISALLGSPIVAAFLLMEASGLGGPVLGLVLVPGLFAAGIGTLVFVGLDSLTGYGTFSLTIPDLPAFHHVTGAMLGWAVAAGVVCTVLGTAIRLVSLFLRPVVERHLLPLTALAGLAVAACAWGFATLTGRGPDQVLFSGQDALPGLIGGAATWTVGALLVLVAAKSLAYGISLSSFRGGAVFPSMFIGAALGIAGSRLPGLPLVPAVAMGIGAMCTVMLRLPLSSTMLATFLLVSVGVTVVPLAVVAVVVAYVLTARLPQTPDELRALWSASSSPPDPAPAPATAPAATATATA